MKKPDRLARPRDFQRVLSGRSLYSGRGFVAFVTPRPDAGSRVGITVSRRLKGAVKRNRARRRLREVARQVLLSDDSPLRSEGMSYDVVLIARPAALELDFDALRQEGSRLMEVIRAVQ